MGAVAVAVVLALAAIVVSAIVGAVELVVVVGFWRAAHVMQVWENLVQLSASYPVSGNRSGSYLTMYSQGGLFFGESPDDVIYLPHVRVARMFLLVF